VIQLPPGTALPSLLSLHQWICPHQHHHCCLTPSLHQSMAVAGLLPLHSSHHLPSPSHESPHPPSSIFQPELFSNVSSGAKVHTEQKPSAETLWEAVVPLPAAQPLPAPQGWGPSAGRSSGGHHSNQSPAPGGKETTALEQVSDGAAHRQ